MSLEEIIKNQKPEPLNVTIEKEIDRLEKSVEFLEAHLQSEKNRLHFFKNCLGVSVIRVDENTPENRLRNWEKFKDVWRCKFTEPFEYDTHRSMYYNLARLYAYNGYTEEEHLPQNVDGFELISEDQTLAGGLEDLIGRCELLEWNDITCMVEVYGTQYEDGPRKIFDFFGNEIGFYVDDKDERASSVLGDDITEDMEGAWFYYRNA
jgi:hypothetical protein